MRQIHTSIVSRHLSTRRNNKIMCTPLPHIYSSEERLPRLTRRTLAQHRTNKSLFLKSYLHKVDAKSNLSPLCPLCNSHTQHISCLQWYPHTHHVATPVFVDCLCRVTELLVRWTEKLDGEPQAGRSDSSH